MATTLPADDPKQALRAGELDMSIEELRRLLLGDGYNSTDNFWQVLIDKGCAGFPSKEIH